MFAFFAYNKLTINLVQPVLKCGKIRNNCRTSSKLTFFNSNIIDMNKTTSKATKRQGSSSNLSQKTEKKKGTHAEVPIISKSTVWLNKQKISVLLQEGTQNLWNMVEGTSWNKLLTKKHLRVANHPRIKINRARILDWLLDVCCAFQLRWESYWCTIELLDYLIFVIDCVGINNLHLISVTSLFISSKIHETNPPTLRKIIERAVYNSFTEKDVINMEANIILQCSNNSLKPKYMETIYNCLYELYPDISLEDKIESMRRFILIWMDPVTALKLQRKNCDEQLQGAQNESLLISYEDIVRTVVKGVEQNRENSNFNKVQQFYKVKYECQNLQVRWKGFFRMKI